MSKSVSDSGETKHTQGKLVVVQSGPCIEIRDEAKNWPVVSWPGFDDSSVSREVHAANAARLELCWNSHDALVELAEMFRDSVEQAKLGPLRNTPAFRERWSVPAGMSLADWTTERIRAALALTQESGK